MVLKTSALNSDLDGLELTLVKGRSLQVRALEKLGEPTLLRTLPCRTSKITEQAWQSACSENLYWKASNLICFMSPAQWHRNATTSCMAWHFLVTQESAIRSSISRNSGMCIATHMCTSSANVRIFLHCEEVSILRADYFGSNKSARASVCCTNTCRTLLFNKTLLLIFSKLDFVPFLVMETDHFFLDKYLIVKPHKGHADVSRCAMNWDKWNPSYRFDSLESIFCQFLGF